MNNKEIDAKEYFNYLKNHINKVDEKDLIDFYNGCLLLVEKYKITGQDRLLSKIKFLIECVDKEYKLVRLGINSFIYRDEIEDYIDNVSKNTVKIIELENYPRDIPDNIVNVIKQTKDIFDKMYIVFTDYTGKVERQIEKDRREKDPILFGTFQHQGEGRNGSNILNDKFYFLGDWEDEYCDLTIDKFLKEVGREKLQKFGIPKNKKEIIKELNRLDSNYRRLNNKEVSKTKSNILQRIFKQIKNEK